MQSNSAMVNEQYSMAFTTGGIFHRESVKVANLFFEIKDWNSVYDKALSSNILQTRTLSTAKRVCREVVSRLRTLCPQELDLLIEGNVHEQGHILWVAVCRRYTFIAEFAVEVLRERFVSLKGDLFPAEFDSFFNRKSEWHHELDRIQPTTKAKLRQVLFKILREADLLSLQYTINPAVPSSNLLQAIACGNRRDVQFFPVVESDIKGWVQ
jgi:hypothetical protein